MKLHTAAGLRALYVGGISCFTEEMDLQYIVSIGKES